MLADEAGEVFGEGGVVDAPLIAQLPEPQATRQIERVATYVGTDTRLVMAEITNHIIEHAQPFTRPPAATGGRRHRAR